MVRRFWHGGRSTRSGVLGPVLCLAGVLLTLGAAAGCLPDPSSLLEGRRGGLSSSQYPGARWEPAAESNFADGRLLSIGRIVVHTIQGSDTGAVATFDNPRSRVSAHYVVGGNDGAVTQTVREEDTAWHAGNGVFNASSIGIEHEGFVDDPERWYTDTLYETSANLVGYLCRKYDIPMDREHIVGHDEVPDPDSPRLLGGDGHHTDPGDGWDWAHFMALVQQDPSAGRVDDEDEDEDEDEEGDDTTASPDDEPYSVTDDSLLECGCDSSWVCDEDRPGEECACDLDCRLLDRDCSCDDRIGRCDGDGQEPFCECDPDCDPLREGCSCDVDRWCNADRWGDDCYCDVDCGPFNADCSCDLSYACNPDGRFDVDCSCDPDCPI